MAEVALVCLMNEHVARFFDRGTLFFGPPWRDDIDGTSDPSKKDFDTVNSSNKKMRAHERNRLDKLEADAELATRAEHVGNYARKLVVAVHRRKIGPNTYDHLAPIDRLARGIDLCFGSGRAPSSVYCRLCAHLVAVADDYVFTHSNGWELHVDPTIDRHPTLDKLFDVGRRVLAAWMPVMRARMSSSEVESGKLRLQRQRLMLMISALDGIDGHEALCRTFWMLVGRVQNGEDVAEGWRVTTAAYLRRCSDKGVLRLVRAGVLKYRIRGQIGDAHMADDALVVSTARDLALEIVKRGLAGLTGSVQGWVPL